MNGIILAAGFGTRLGELGKRHSKAFLPVGRKSAIDWVVDSINVPTVDAIHVVHNARWAASFRRWRESIREESVPDRPCRYPYFRVHNDGVTSSEYRLGAVGDLEWLLRRLGAARAFVLAPVDTISSFDISLLLDEAFSRGGSNAVVLTTRTVDGVDSQQLGKVDVDPEGVLVNFYEKPAVQIDTAWLGPAYFPEAAVPLIHQYCFEARTAGTVPDRLGDLVRWLIGKVPIRCWRGDDAGVCFDIGTPHGYESANAYFGR